MKHITRQKKQMSCRYVCGSSVRLVKESCRLTQFTISCHLCHSWHYLNSGPHINWQPGIILKVVEIQCFEIKSYVSRSLLILCTLLKAGDTSLINDIQQKVYIFFFKFWTLQLSIQSKINIKMFALKDTKNIIFHIFESKYSWMDLWVCIYPKRTPLDPLL